MSLNIFSTIPAAQQALGTVATLQQISLDPSMANQAATYSQQLADGSISKAEFQDLMIDLRDQTVANDAANTMEIKAALSQAISTLISVAALLPIP